MSDFESKINVICLGFEAFDALVDKVADRFKDQVYSSLDPWVNKDDAKRIVHIRSDATFLKLRDEGKFDYRRIGERKIIVYRRQSLLDFIENSPK
ncbi:hypothetical protein [Flavilitoribacter nigricans]|uniref:DNA-binding protein n=1 Tax=Flavilitoribacter nigricans (strain ATCC 23147 / DSM 23189 / NBRC 102662 / NCIMB 1420 / SS-2) TaxID=1122177 RepID=A0A2D0MXF9_FLAN2|nr:hypothetical protein [Flavilitoribacter nigricans]PHN00925.1 hypothetical protein CRP01_39715 [Flavilitoribacter nigricans DSM 23189 = NBRC 102662]